MDNEEYFAFFDRHVLSKRDTVLRRYFEGHLPRFEAQLNMFREHLDDKSINHVIDFGTGTPFTSYYFYLTQRASVVYGHTERVEETINNLVYQENMNLCHPPEDVMKGDLVICTEVIEHLPCPLLPVIDYLKSMSNKYLLLSFPIGTILKGDFNHDFGNYDTSHIHHLREFTPELSDEFLSIVGWDIIADETIFTQAYGGDIRNVLLRRR
jgi:hypothetical protein